MKKTNILFLVAQMLMVLFVFLVLLWYSTRPNDKYEIISISIYHNNENMPVNTLLIKDFPQKIDETTWQVTLLNNEKVHFQGLWIASPQKEMDQVFEKKFK